MGSINSGKSIIVNNVHEFLKHIACNPLSKSEIVISVFKDGKVIAVLDIDSKKFNVFDEIDIKGLEKIISLL
ncbi:MAG: hypothetical protein M0P36_04970 [Bacteroidales bacterium]|nr:hypothetical protein [Bacteroidales bacterium]